MDGLSPLAKEYAVFDLDNTTLEGDIGDSVFEQLALDGTLRSQVLTMVDPVTGIESGLPTSVREYLNSADDSFVTRYQELIKIAQEQRIPGLTASIYLWMTRCMSHLSRDEIQAATAKAWQRRQASEDILRLHSKTAALIAYLRLRGVEVHIVSATNSFSVRWVIEEILNPFLKSQGAELGIPATSVHGVRWIQEIGTKRSTLEFPAPTFGGKAAIVHAHIGSQPLIVAGDSENDVAMLRLARFPVWVSRPGHHPQGRSAQDQLAQRLTIFHTS